jgi:phenylacetate-CoA ligase
MERETRQRQQLLQLNRLLNQLNGHNSFYTRKLRMAGLCDGVDSLETFMRRMPFTTKQELIDDQQMHSPYGSNLTYPVEAYCRFHQTSGTTTAPMRWLDTRESWAWVVSNWVHIFRAAGVTSESRILFAFSFGPFLGFWSAHDAAQKMGCLCIAGGGMSSEARLQVLLDNQIDVMCCTPTYALRLADVARSQNFSLDACSLKKIIVAGEPGGSIPAIRNRIETAWGNGCRVFDHHGMTEVGPVSYECVDVPGVLHVNESAYLAEVLDAETLQPVGEGEVGELVLTTLGREASPLLRYRTGDMVKPSWKGKPEFASDDVALVGGLIGRYDDMMVIRGVNVFPSMVDAVIRSQNDIHEYRVNLVTKDSMVEMTIEIEVAEAAKQSEVVYDLETALCKSLHLRVPVMAVSEEALPRFEMKARRWIKSDKRK